MAKWIPNIAGIDEVAPPMGIGGTTGELDILYYSPAVILASYLINDILLMEAPNGTSEWPLFISHMPEAGQYVKDNAGAIYDSAGTMDGRLMSGKVIEHYGVQIKIRSLTQIVGYLKISTLCEYLRAVKNTTVAVVGYDFKIHNLMKTSPIVSLGIDEKRRYLFTVNYIATLNLV